jgi:hypothetical protein
VSLEPIGSALFSPRAQACLKSSADDKKSLFELAESLTQKPGK